MSVTTTGMRHITAANLADVTGRKQASSQEAFEDIARTLMPLRGTPACLVPSGSATTQIVRCPA